MALGFDSDDTSFEELNDSIIEKLKTCKIYEQPEGWVIEYPQFAKVADQQMHTFWAWDEPDVENDVQDLRVRMSDAERHAITETLKLFTLYEMHVGDDYWSGRIMRKFKRPEIQRMASMFSCVEFNSHAPFYNQVNERLFIDTEEFYSEWKEDEVLSERMSMIEDVTRNKNDVISTAAFSFAEGAILYTNFAFFKHFQSQECGKDLIKNVNRGIDLSVGDENLHAIGGALLHNQIRSEVNDSLTQAERNFIDETIYTLAQNVFAHECLIIGKLFEKGELNGVTKENMINFVRHRINLCLQQIQLQPIFTDEEITDTFIESWFYKDINSLSLHDFFTGNGNEYNINWNEAKFGEVWK
jgi:ribonucleotide reductase beta subunit family protein with ferritin-like domain